MHNDKIVTVEVGDKVYDVACACTEEEREEGLQNVAELPEGTGMLFIFDEPQHVGFWMKDTLVPLDIVYIDEYGEVISVHKGEPESEEVFEEDDVKYVLEVNQGSGIQAGEDVEIDGLNDESVMHVLGEDGSTQMELTGGERIFSRGNTKTLARLAKKAYASKNDKDYKALGRKVFSYLRIQNDKEDDFVELPE